MKEKIINSVKIFLFVFLIPILESFLLKYITISRFVLDFDYLIIGFISFYILLQNIKQTNNILFKSNRKAILLNLLSFLSYAGIISIMYKHLSLVNSPPVRFVLMILALTIILTGLISFIDLSILNNHKLKFLILTLLLFTIAAYPTLNLFLWRYLSSSTCKIVCCAINLFGYNNVSMIEDFTLKSPIFKISIHSMCSGLEGISFFITSFSIFLIILSDNSLKLNFILFSYVIGIIYMYFLNIIRITAYFLFGLSLTSKYNSADAVKSILKLFHSNIGWILYLIGISLFIIIWLYLRKAIKKNV